jgi:tetratricopeptide (TPR) repeat protein
MPTMLGFTARLPRLPRAALALLLGFVVVACARPAEENLRKGNVYFSSRKFEEARREFQRAVEADPRSAAAREGIANVDFELGRLELAEKEYQEAIAVDPKALTSRHKLAVTLATRGRNQDAIDALDKALEIAPKDTYALSFAGNLYHRMGDDKRAEQLQLQALAIQEDYHAARYALGNLLLESHRPEEAERQFSILMAKGAPALGLYGFARLAAVNGKLEDAARNLEKLLEAGVSEPARILSDPIFASAWSHPAMAAVRQKLLALPGGQGGQAPAAATSTTVRTATHAPSHPE